MASSDSSSSANGDRDVFGSLPNTRPQRRSARRDRAKAKPAAAKAKPAARARPAAQAKAGIGAKPDAAAEAKPAARSKPAAGAKAAARAKPSAAAQAKAGARAKPAAQAKPAAKAAPPRATEAQIPPAGYATPRGGDDGVPHGAELVTTAVQAAGELAQIGLAAGGRALKSALGRLPRP
ncbi:MAG TPA: hypothetical protein VFQ51_09955 [Vicinamibacteria bacterium]|nr:hypothetical protein [Vicinamibacteria bacterium]